MVGLCRWSGLGWLTWRLLGWDTAGAGLLRMGRLGVEAVDRGHAHGLRVGCAWRLGVEGGIFCLHCIMLRLVRV